jgi:DNA invertase Pin-like site-specific DNA recombinase
LHQDRPREGDRRELLKLPDGLAPGDVVTVMRIGRLARSTLELFAIISSTSVPR